MSHFAAFLLSYSMPSAVNGTWQQNAEHHDITIWVKFYYILWRERTWCLTIICSSSCMLTMKSCSDLKMWSYSLCATLEVQVSSCPQIWCMVGEGMNYVVQAEILSQTKQFSFIRPRASKDWASLVTVMLLCMKLLLLCQTSAMLILIQIMCKIIRIFHFQVYT